MSYPDIMIDIETLSSESNAVVVSIGAIAFDIKEGLSGNNPKKYIIFNTIRQIQDGRHIQDKTRTWWSKQSQVVQDELAKSYLVRVPVEYALTEFTNWCTEQQAEHIWGNGNTFDNMVMRNLYKQYNCKYPVGFRGDLDMRTLKFLAPNVNVPRMGNHHNGLDDAVYQADVVCEMYADLYDI